MLAPESIGDLCAFGSDFDVCTGEARQGVDSRSSPKDVPMASQKKFFVTSRLYMERQFKSMHD